MSHQSDCSLDVCISVGPRDRNYAKWLDAMGMYSCMQPVGKGRGARTDMILADSDHVDGNRRFHVLFAQP